MRVGGTILEWGYVPPPKGPLRDAYLEESGRNELAIFERELAKAIETLRVLDPDSLNVPPLESADDRVRVDQHARLNSYWADIRREIGPDTIRKAQPSVRAAERAAVRALNFLEDNALADAAHRGVHVASQLRRGLLGCPIEFRDGAYWTTCPFALAHVRVGFSAGITGSFVCSACGAAMEDCDHLPGAQTEHVKRGGAGSCNICLEPACDHVDGQIYVVAVRPIGENFTAHEVSMVPRPMYPQARFTEIEVTDDLDERARALARAGRLNCDECLGPCDGLLDARSWGARVGLPIH